MNLNPKGLLRSKKNFSAITTWDAIQKVFPRGQKQPNYELFNCWIDKKIFFVTLVIGEFLWTNFLRLDCKFGPGSADDELLYYLLPYCFACIGKKTISQDFEFLKHWIAFNDEYKTIPSL